MFGWLFNFLLNQETDYLFQT